MACRRDQDPAVLKGSEDRSGNAAATASNRREHRASPLSSDAVGRARCHELRIRDEDQNWRLMYRIDPDAIVIVDVFAKKTGRTPKNVIETCKARLRTYDAVR